MKFVKIGKCAHLFPGERDERIWLGLKNNTRWAILVSTFGVPAEYGEAGLYYRVEAFGPAVPDGPVP